ncbi:hypothetical protein RA28_07785 [Ruegeria sp. ANG-S4]|uniref:adenylate/guanylate cyclase domain-containing protein n=1 Tax=Ruegeria sp. ANG-S4 TaxID=1577904 RepID=UPI00057F4464|nr:tetratricopeptide repeat protein [Ruegeria sp. ANG-S4]KIC45619.1 hypothetical protein RA28_07785 [Ruegeria sp. ANG-S4]
MSRWGTSDISSDSVGGRVGASGGLGAVLTGVAEQSHSVPDIDAQSGLLGVPAEKTERRMLCVSFIDVVGFSAQMRADEEGTFHRWVDMRDDVVLPLLRHFDGQLIKLTGDGILATFDDAVSAVRWSAELQMKARQRRQGLSLRVSLHYCSVLRDGDDLLGDGLNVAARLQEHAPVGGVILTDAVAEQISGLPELVTRPIGLLNLRKMQGRIGAHELITDGRPSTDKQKVEPALPTIAVIPLANIGGRDEDEYLCAGIVEDIVVSLSGQRDLMVISRSSTLSLARQAVDPRVVGEVLGVRYVITGTLRRSGDRIRISTELLDTDSGQQLASLRRDFDSVDVFAVQDEIVESTLVNLLPGMHSAERRKTLRKWPGSYTAYDDYLKALDQIGGLERQPFDEARIHLSRAMMGDPGFSSAYAWAARWHSLRVGQGWSDDPQRDANEAINLAKRAIGLDEQNALALATYGHVKGYMFGDFETAISYLDRARETNPNSSIAWLLSSVTLSSLGRTDEAIHAAERALRLSPLDQRLFIYYVFLGITCYDAGEFERAVMWLSRGLAENPRYTSALRTLAVSHIALDQIDEARSAVNRLMELEPGFRMSSFKGTRRLYSDPARADLFRARLSQAGAPE